MQKLIYAIGGFVGLLLLIGLLLPQTHRIEAKTEIDAHAATVFALLNDPQRFAEWSPWIASDPNARVLFAGPPRGVGAALSWDGTIIGNGRQVITQSQPYDFVGITMSPGEDAEAKSWFQLTPGVGTTIVTWGFEADHGYNVLGRYFASMLGGIVARDYNDGLSRLKALAEGLPRADFADLEIEQLTVAAVDIAYLPTTSTPDPAAIADSLGKAYFAILNFMDQNGLSSAGAPLSILKRYSGSTLQFDAAIPVRGLDETTSVDTVIQIATSYAGPVLRVRHVGSYRGLSTTHRKIAAYLAAYGVRTNGAAWESYVSDPGQVEEAELLTYVYYPIVLTSD